MTEAHSELLRSYAGRFDDIGVLITGLSERQAAAIETHFLQNYSEFLGLNEATESMSLPIYEKYFKEWVEQTIEPWFRFGG